MSVPWANYRRSRTTRQFGYRRPDGQIVWLHQDRHGNGVTRLSEARKIVHDFQNQYQDCVGKVVPVELVSRDFLHSEWGRWTKSQRSGEFVGANN